MELVLPNVPGFQDTTQSSWRLPHSQIGKPRHLQGCLFRAQQKLFRLWNPLTVRVNCWKYLVFDIGLHLGKYLVDRTINWGRPPHLNWNFERKPESWSIFYSVWCLFCPLSTNWSVHEHHECPESKCHRIHVPPKPSRLPSPSIPLKLLTHCSLTSTNQGHAFPYIPQKRAMIIPTINGSEAGQSPCSFPLLWRWGPAPSTVERFNVWENTHRSQEDMTINQDTKIQVRSTSCKSWGFSKHITPTPSLSFPNRINQCQGMNVLCWYLISLK